MRTKPIFKLIKSVRFHLKNQDSFKIDTDIRNVIKVTQHFKVLSTKMTKYPDMDISKKLINYVNDLQNLMQKYPAFPEFKPQEQKQFVQDLLTVYYFIYFDLQDKCQTKTINTTVKQAKTAAFKKTWRTTEASLQKSGNVILDSRLVTDGNLTQNQAGTLIIEYLPKSKIQETFK